MAARGLLLDANVIVRFLAADHGEHLERSKALVADAESGKGDLTVMPWVLAEAVYVLSSVYEVNQRDVARALTAFINGAGIITEDHEVMEDALQRFAGKRVDFADALLAAYAAQRDVDVASFDRDLDRFEDTQRVEP